MHIFAHNPLCSLGQINQKSLNSFFHTHDIRRLACSFDELAEFQRPRPYQVEDRGRDGSQHPISTTTSAQLIQAVSSAGAYSPGASRALPRFSSERDERARVREIRRFEHLSHSIYLSSPTPLFIPTCLSFCVRSSLSVPALPAPPCPFFLFLFSFPLFHFRPFFNSQLLHVHWTLPQFPTSPETGFPSAMSSQPVARLAALSSVDISDILFMLGLSAPLFPPPFFLFVSSRL